MKHGKLLYFRISNLPYYYIIIQIKYRGANIENGTKIGVGKFETKDFVIKEINSSINYRTAFKIEGTKYKVRGKILVISNNYLRTYGNKIEENNLGNLPKE